MVCLVLGTKSLEDENSILDGRSLDLDRLEATLQGGILLDVFAVFVERRRADALEFAAAEGRLDDVGSVHGPLSGSCTDDRVELVDEEDDVLVLADLVHDRLDPLLELAAVFRTRHHEGEVEGDDALVGEKLGYVARDNFLREALGNGGLPDAGLADENRVVLATAAENLDDALDLVSTADDRIEFPLAGALGEVASEGL